MKPWEKQTLDAGSGRVPRRGLPYECFEWRRLSSAALLVAVSVLVAFAVRIEAQPYSTDWFKVAGGGGTSTNGQYSISGTIGQPDAGAMSGGSYSVVGGFWAIVSAVQTPGAPLLRIEPTATNAVVVAWPAPSSGFKLQVNANLSTTNWTDVGQTPTVVGGENQVIVVSPSGNWFYRLRWP
jgi:hypothetical protein